MQDMGDKRQRLQLRPQVQTGPASTVSRAEQHALLFGSPLRDNAPAHRRALDRRASKASRRCRRQRAAPPMQSGRQRQWTCRRCSLPATASPPPPPCTSTPELAASTASDSVPATRALRHPSDRAPARLHALRMSKHTHDAPASTRSAPRLQGRPLARARPLSTRAWSDAHQTHAPRKAGDSIGALVPPRHRALAAHPRATMPPEPAERAVRAGTPAPPLSPSRLQAHPRHPASVADPDAKPETLFPRAFQSDNAPVRRARRHTRDAPSKANRVGRVS
ncbi:hypothetical protein B0H17DRAFT_1213195 [Mycena rosella]|uniref:Uncharacterized protein n=1 Tax=Mycena rosella TaxID=1033263 RepID=A0AAD7CQM5_MYCRO|nr:hypothetical protein B0H17DRAFT_1213195 [Mycena rosella]